MRMHSVIELVGWIATILTLASGLPQTIKLVLTRDRIGVSEWTYILWAATAMWWAGWGFHVGSVPMVVVNLLLLPLLVTVVVLLGPNRSQVTFLLSSMPLLALAFLISPSLVAVVGTILACLLAVPSVIAAFRTEDPSGVAIGTWIFLAVASVLWVTYDIGIGYPLTATSLVVQAGLSGVVVGRTVFDRRRLALRMVAQSTE